ncbi:MAG: DNA repair exonuclease [Bacteroidetes bacterium]|nr:DNA repair exonuclease [Bacteroidota bacterium]MCY4205884.1 DNA repair exonuclease [Bacteroidota bacterium]
MIKLLCLGDAHLGRYPTRVPTNNPNFSVRAVWDTAISHAIEENVDAVILSGDMADNENSYFESFGALSSGITRLKQSGISVVAIAGNHDYDVFPELAKSMPAGHFKFLGKNGEWSEVTLNTNSGRSLRCVGWSFPTPHFERSPLDSLKLAQSDSFTIGVVHGEYEGSGKYAPLAKQDLASKPVDFWLLGHVHTPKLYDKSRAPVLYPGSPQPLDPGEPGVHGPWMIIINENNEVKAKQLPLASIHYEEIPIDLSGIEETESAYRAVAEQLEKFAKQLTQNRPLLQHLSCRLALQGQTSLHRRLSTEGLTNIDTFETQINECMIAIEKVSIQTSPTRDLQEIAQLNNDPPGMLARWILNLETTDDHALVDCASGAASVVYRSAGFKALSEPKPDPDILLGMAKQQAMLLLDELLAQKEDHD